MGEIESPAAALEQQPQGVYIGNSKQDKSSIISPKNKAKFEGLGVSITNPHIGEDACKSNGRVVCMGIQETENELDKYIVTANEIIPDSTVALQQSGTPIMSLGDISCITGAPKSRKTYLLTAMAVAFLSEAFLSMETELEEKRLVIADTEQSRKFTKGLITRIYRMMKWDYNDTHPELLVLTLRELTPDNRWKMVQRAIDEYKPQLVFIDGVADLINDSNNIEESAAIVNELMKVSSEKDCHISCILHTNPNSEKSRGHLGSEMQRKAETTLLVSRDGEITHVKPQFCRNIEFQPFAFIVNDKGLPEECGAIETKAPENLKTVITDAFSEQQKFSYGKLRDRLKEQLNKSGTACENRIKKAISEKIIYRDMDGNYRLYGEPIKQDLPFEPIADEDIPI